MVLVRPRIWPETTDTAPNSPIARALQIITPYSSPHLTLRQRDAKKSLPAVGAKRDRRLLFVGAIRLHHRNQLARDEGKGHEIVASTMPGNRENDPDIVRNQPIAEPALRAEHQYDRSGRKSPARPRTADRSGSSASSCRETRTWRSPRRPPDAENEVERHRDRRDVSSVSSNRAQAFGSVIDAK